MVKYFEGKTKKEIEEHNRYWHHSKDFDPDISYEYEDVEKKIIDHTELEISRALDELSECIEPSSFTAHYSKDQERVRINKLDKIPRDALAQELLDRYGGTLDTAIIMAMRNNCRCIAKNL